MHKNATRGHPAGWQVARTIAVCLTALQVVLSGCSAVGGMIYVKFELREASGLDSANDDRIPWVRNVKFFTGKLPVPGLLRSNRDGRFAGVEVSVTKADDLSLQGEMTYRQTLLKQPDGTYRLVDEKQARVLTYRFDFDRLSNEMVVTFPGEGETKNAYSFLRFGCSRATP